jgi:hypothetical protein
MELGKRIYDLRVKSGSTFKTLSFSGNGTFTWNGNTVWHAGNDGSGSGLDADTVDGLHVSKAGNTKPWGTIVSIGTDGVSEMGKYIDFHLTDTSTADYDFRFTCESSEVMKCSGKLYGAVWNDYAEFRKYKDGDQIPYGRVVIENGDDSLSLSTQRMQKGGNICSDTFGFAIGETEET